jgi:hypothetical protein
MNLTQLEPIKMELKHGRYEQNKIGRTYMRLTKDFWANRKDSRDTLNSARE